MLLKTIRGIVIISTGNPIVPSTILLITISIHLLPGLSASATAKCSLRHLSHLNLKLKSMNKALIILYLTVNFQFISKNSTPCN